MELEQKYVCVILLVGILHIHALTAELNFGWTDAISNQTEIAYNIGVDMGIINPKKYSFKTFKQDQLILKTAYEECTSLMNEETISYQQWLIMNNYGILEGTGDSLIQKKSKALRQRTTNKDQFMSTVKTGDILISTRNSGGIVGHAAIMVSDYWVLEMRGGKKWRQGIPNNNRQVSKSRWFNDYGHEWTTVFRYFDSSVAQQAALWADRTYHNPAGGPDKTICVTYKITPDFFSTDPSYSSKLVLQAYYFSSPGVVGDLDKYGDVIAPTRLPSYFKPPYYLIKIGKF